MDQGTLLSRRLPFGSSGLNVQNRNPSIGAPSGQKMPENPHQMAFYDFRLRQKERALGISQFPMAVVVMQTVAQKSHSTKL